MNLSTVKWAQCDKTQYKELLGLFICVCTALCTIVAHSIVQNRADNFPSYPQDNHLLLRSCFNVSTIVLLSILSKKPIFITNYNVCYYNFILATKPRFYIFLFTVC